MQFRDLTDQVFGYLTAVEHVGFNKYHKALWSCRCSCGNFKTVNAGTLVSGHSKSCGCKKGSLVTASKIKHGCSVGGKQTPEYNAYISSKRRCTNPNIDRYPKYGGRGIEFRFNSFDEFFAALGPKPAPNYTINRKDNNGHYEPGNVEWASPRDQIYNRSVTVIFTHNKISQTVDKWSDDTGISKATLLCRRHYGWCDSCIVSRPLRDRNLCTHK